MSNYIPHNTFSVMTYPYLDIIALHWRHNYHDGVSNHQLHGCLLNRLFRRRSKKASCKAPRHWSLSGEFTGTGEFHAQRASYAENVSIWWRHHWPALRAGLLCCNFFGQPGSVSKFPPFLWVKLWVGWVGRGYTEISRYFPASWINWVTLVTKIKLLYSLRF